MPFVQYRNTKLSRYIRDPGCQQLGLPGNLCQQLKAAVGEHFAGGVIVGFDGFIGRGMVQCHARFLRFPYFVENHRNHVRIRRCRKQARGEIQVIIELAGSTALRCAHQDHFRTEIAGDFHVQPGDIGFGSVRYQSFNDDHIHFIGDFLVFTDHVLHQQVGFAMVQQLLGFFQRNRVGWFQVAAGTHKGHRRILAVVMKRFASVYGLTEWFVKADAHSFPFQGTQKTKAYGCQAGVKRGWGYEKTFCHDCSRFHS